MSEIPEPEPKILTLLEANAKLSGIIPVLKRLQRLQRALAGREQQHEGLSAALANGNGHAHVSLQDQPHAGIAQHDQLLAEAQAALLELEESGAVLKDPDAGLIDFYGRRAGELIFLCWRLGEEEDRIRFWHTLDGGFASRQPVDALIQ